MQWFNGTCSIMKILYCIYNRMQTFCSISNSVLHIYVQKTCTFLITSYWVLFFVLAESSRPSSYKSLNGDNDSFLRYYEYRLLRTMIFSDIIHYIYIYINLLLSLIFHLKMTLSSILLIVL